MCMVTILPADTLTVSGSLRKHHTYMHIKIDLSNKNQCNTRKTAVKVYGPSGSSVTFLSPNENSHVKVLNIAQHCLGVV